MPIYWLYIGGGALLAGGGLKLAGDGVEDAGNGALKMTGAAAIAAGLYLTFKRGK